MVQTETMRSLPTAALTVTGAILIALCLAPTVSAQQVRRTERIAGDTRSDTAAALARRTAGDPQVIYLVASTDFADGLMAGVAAAARGGVVALLDPDGIPPATRDLLADSTGADVVVVGGTRRLPAALDDAIAQVTGTRPARIAGPDRYATAAAVAASVHDGRVDDVWVVAGTTAPDALSAGPAASTAGAALLSTTPDALPEATRRALTALDPHTVTVVGGEAVVSADVIAEIEMVTDARVRRISGDDRYATSAAVASAAFPKPTTAVVTTGRLWADALAATPLAASLDAPVLLVPRRCVTAEVITVVSTIDRIIIAGGDVAVSPRVDDLSPCAEEVAAVGPEELGPSWRPGCPVDPVDLRRITVDYHALDGGGVRVGALVVHRSVAASLVELFDRLFLARFPLHRVTTVDTYGGDDDLAMAANATTAFNCRTVGGSSQWSEHAYGTAIDINPVQNPYVTATSVLPSAGAAYLDRTTLRPGMVVSGDAVDRAFAAIGWGWGGRWRSAKDYQHFSASGR